MSSRVVLLGGFSAAGASALRRALPPDGGWDVLAVPAPADVAAALASGPPPAFVCLAAAALGSANVSALCRAVRRAVPPPSSVRLEVLLPALSPDAVRAAYGAGADECRSGPVSAETLALFVLAKAPPPAKAAADDFRFNPASGVARVGGRPLALTSTEVRFLREFVSRPGVACTRGQLLRAVLGEKAGSVQPRAVDSAVAELRRKLGPAGWRLETAWGRGYRWNDATRPPPGARLVRRRARVAGSCVLVLLLAFLAVRALRPVSRTEAASASVSVPEASDPVVRALLEAFGTDAPPAVDVARPKRLEDAVFPDCSDG